MLCCPDWGGVPHHCPGWWEGAPWPCPGQEVPHPVLNGALDVKRSKVSLTKYGLKNATCKQCLRCTPILSWLERLPPSCLGWGGEGCPTWDWGTSPSRDGVNPPPELYGVYPERTWDQWKYYGMEIGYLPLERTWDQWMPAVTIVNT